MTETHDRRTRPGPSRRSVLRGAAGAGVAVGIGLAIGGVRAATAPSPAAARFPGDPGAGNIVYGAATHPGLPVADFEAQVDATLGCHRNFFQAADWEALARQANNDVNAHRVPLVSTKVPDDDWRGVADGLHDDWLGSVTDALGAVPGPVWFCLHHEPYNEGTTPQDYRDMYAHAATFTGRHQNIALTPILNGWIWQDGNPGDWQIPEADLVGVDAYNQWYEDENDPGDYGRWRTPQEIWGGPIQTCAQWGKPMLVAEYGVRYARQDPGKSRDWMIDAYDYALGQGVVALSYFNSGLNSPNGSWVLDGERLEAYTQLIHRSTSVNPA